MQFLYNWCTFCQIGGGSIRQFLFPPPPTLSCEGKSPLNKYWRLPGLTDNERNSPVYYITKIHIYCYKTLGAWVLWSVRLWKSMWSPRMSYKSLYNKRAVLKWQKSGRLQPQFRRQNTPWLFLASTLENSFKANRWLHCLTRTPRPAPSESLALVLLEAGAHPIYIFSIPGTIQKHLETKDEAVLPATRTKQQVTISHLTPHCLSYPAAGRMTTGMPNAAPTPQKKKSTQQIHCNIFKKITITYQT